MGETNSVIKSGSAVGFKAESADHLPEYILRFDSRTPEEIEAAGGFKAWGNDDNLYNHVNGSSIQNKTSAFIGATENINVLQEWIEGYEEGYIYIIKLLKMR